MAIDPDTVPGCGDGISVRVIASTAERLYSSLALYRWDIAPGEGLTGKGDEQPLPCPDVSLETFFHASSRATPASRPLPRPPPAPSRGGGQCVMTAGGKPCRG